MKTLRNSKVLAIFGALAVALAVTLVAAPTAEAGGYGYGYVKSYHVVKPVYPSCGFYPTYYPTYYAPTYYTPTYYAPSCGYPW